MRKIYISLFMLVFNVLCVQAKQLKVLFIGNSYTYYNNLPQLVGSLATASGDQLVHSSSTPGGYTFQQHATDQNTINLIQQGNWDFVVLQEQSQRPSFPDAQVASDVYPYARKLDSLIKVYNPCAKTVFYMTWGRKNGDQSNCQFFPPLCTYVGMDSMLQLRYTIMADSNNAVLSPVAKVWRKLRTNNPGIELYDADESHPSPKGSFAAACAFYSIFFQKDPTQTNFNATLTAAEALTIKTAAKNIVFDSLAKWYQYYPNITANFNHNINGLQVTFNNTSLNATSYKWYFGDGDSSILQNPVHTYPNNSNRQVMLIAGKCSDYDTITKTVQFTTSIENSPVGPTSKVYPNPARQILYIESATAIRNIIAVDVAGRKVFTQNINRGNKTSIDIKQWTPGIYYLLLMTDTGTESQRFFKQPE